LEDDEAAADSTRKNLFVVVFPPPFAAAGKIDTHLPSRKEEREDGAEEEQGVERSATRLAVKKALDGCNKSGLELESQRATVFCAREDRDEE